MKKILLLALLLVSFQTFAQTSTIPNYAQIHKKGTVPEKSAPHAGPKIATKKSQLNKAIDTDSTENPIPEATVDTPSDDKVYTSVDQMPQLPGGGGSEAISKAIQNATKYPALAIQNQVQGRVFVSFTVEPQGDVSGVKVVKGIGSGLDEEVVQAVKSLPTFIPGKQNGRAVRVSYTLPVMFSLQPKPVTVPSADVKPKTFRGGILGSLISSRTLLLLVTRHP